MTEILFARKDNPVFTGTITGQGANFSGTVTFAPSTITSLMPKLIPDPSDQVIIYDAAGVAVKSATVGSLISAQASFKNFLINSSFQIMQYGPGPFTAGATTMTVDRWAGSRLGIAGATFTRVAASTASQSSYAMRIQRTDGDTAASSILLITALDSLTSAYLAGRTITVSGFIKKNSGYSGDAITSRIFYGTGNDQGFETGATAAWTGGAVNNKLVTQGNTNRNSFSHTFTIPSSAKQVGWTIFGSGYSATPASGDYFEIDSLKLEIGSAPTLYQSPSAQQEYTDSALYYEDMSRHPYLGTRWLRVLSMGFANTAGGGIGTNQNIWVHVKHLPKRNFDHTLAVGVDGTNGLLTMHITTTGGTSIWNLVLDAWSHQSLADSLLTMHYVIDGGGNPALANNLSFALAVDGGGVASRFAITSELPIT